MNFRAFTFIAVSASACAPAILAANAYINQVGFRPADPKEFALVDASGNVEIVDASGKTVLQVTPGAASFWDASGQNAQLVDFSELKAEGKYTIKVGGQALRQDLVVKENTFEDVYKAALKWFYYQRASMALEQQYAGQWARAAGHTNATAELHNSTGASGTIQSSKGWYGSVGSNCTPGRSIAKKSDFASPSEIVFSLQNCRISTVLVG